MESWSKQIVGIAIEGLVNPNSCEDRSTAKITCLKAEKDEIVVQVGDETYSTNDPGYVNYGSDRVATAMCQIMSEILISTEDGTNEWSGYLHNYKFANGRVYDEENPIDGFYISG